MYLFLFSRQVFLREKLIKRIFNVQRQMLLQLIFSKNFQTNFFKGHLKLTGKDISLFKFLPAEN